MSKPHITSVSNLPSWLTMAAHIYPPQQVVLVGAGNGTGPLVQWLQSWASDTGLGLPAVTLLEPHAPSRAQLTKRLAGIEACADWQLLPDMLAPEEGEHTYYQYTLATENGLQSLESLHPLWPSLQLQCKQLTAAVTVAHLLPAGWLLVDCLPAAHLLQGTPLPSSTKVVLARVTLGDAAPAGSSLASVEALLASSGFKAVATFTERNSALGKALFVREQLAQSEIDVLKKFKHECAEANKNPYGHNRVLTASLNSSLRDFANKNLGLQQIKPAYLDYLALKAIQVEKNCVGRLATTVQDAVTRQLVVECLTEEKVLILEIGALYGVGMAILYNHAITRAQEVRLICLDPFDGYYGKAIDALLNQPVNDLSFKRNMKLANVPESDYSIVKRYSTDPLALEEVKNHAFNLLIIDGDHSYEGVKFDFEKFFPLLEKGGYVIFDDYNAKEWPGVQKFIDEDLKAHANLQYLGAFSRTAVGRKLY